ncbi:HAL protein kinase [Pochonia chlamydosporia 170]|uniref:non-specific serine/threonine protein kinase n=1 Tax=Pochonia chlamydosporia 170 TaxID=1380566 RepID=A0A179FT72_METCM|nr:HAL protein kinase [Pochonia chlamydosporia 170]OAQ68341.1 HAL protein kinase [Pochonia chlamydosporia 170]
MALSLAHVYPWTSTMGPPQDQPMRYSSKHTVTHNTPRSSSLAQHSHSLPPPTSSVTGTTGTGDQDEPSETPTLAPMPTATDSSTATTTSDSLSLPYYSSSYSSSPRQFPSDITDPILEEGDEESGTDSPIEPVTPVSGGRHSQDFTALHHSHYNDYQALQRAQTTQNPPTANTKKAPLLISQSSAPPAPLITSDLSSTPKASEQETSPQTPLQRRTTRGSSHSLKRTMSRLFRRSNSALEKEREFAVVDSPAPISESAPQSSGYLSTNGTPSSRYPNGNKSSTTTRSSSPPSPGSPLEMTPSNRSTIGTNGTLPNPADFQKKSRAATGLTLRGRAVNFVGATMGRGNRPNKGPRRASSFDMGKRSPVPTIPKHIDEEKTYPPERLPWPLPPDAGTGAKARRMSLSLPDDFTVDVAELLSEFEYQHKLLGRHGKHLGKGAASKVTLMARKGCPGELYAVKEFRGKSNRESQEDYEKKIKSEFSIGKSLHHPNIVETVRLCTDHGRWNHVMEYCSEGDLFSLVQKGFLKGEDKKKDRLCLFKQLIQGVNYLHANGIAHRDIKLENLLLTKDSKLKITDFGVSEVFCGTHPGLREAGGQCGQNMGEVRLCSPGICGSEPYIAPEVLEKKQSYDARALDVWGSAIVMIYLTFGGAIWSRAQLGNLHYDKLVKGWKRWYEKHPECDACITDTDYPNCYALDVGVNPPALRRILLQMLNPDPAKRITINEVVNNRWMRNVECCQLESYDEQAQLIDATKKDYGSKLAAKKIFCHNHLPPKTGGSHSLGKMPGSAGY